MLLPEVPAEVTGDQIERVLEVLGITVPLADLRTMQIGPDRVVVSMLRRNEQGAPFAAGRDIAQIEVDMRIRWAK